MLKKIERPFGKELDVYKYGTSAEVWKAFNQWFQDNIEPLNKLIEDAVEVYNDENHQNEWTEDESLLCKPAAHKAYLIGITPLKPALFTVVDGEVTIHKPGTYEMSYIMEEFDRAKAALEREDGN